MKTSTDFIIYDWMCELLEGRMLLIYAYLFSMLRHDSVDSVIVDSKDLADRFHMEPDSVNHLTRVLAQRGLLSKQMIYVNGKRTTKYFLPK